MKASLESSAGEADGKGSRSPQKISTRNLTLDYLRGYFLFVIAVNHLAKFPNLFEPLTGQHRMWVSAMEGFVFVSGLLVGMLRGRQAKRVGLGSASAKLFQRAGLLYACAIGMIVIAATMRVVLPHFGFSVRMPPYPGGFGDFVLDAFLLKPPGLGGGLLAIYAIFLFFSPVFLLLLTRLHWGVAAGLSFGIWVAGLIIPHPMSLGEGSVWNLATWQFLFFGALVIGYKSEELTRWWNAIPQATRNRIFWYVIPAALVSILVSWLDCYRGALFFSESDFRNFLFDRVRLGPGRVLAFALWFSALYMLVSRFEPWFKRWTAWFLLPYGQNSLHVYILQLLILPFVGKVPTDGFMVNTVVSAAAVLFIWWLTAKRYLFKVIPR